MKKGKKKEVEPIPIDYSELELVDNFEQLDPNELSQLVIKTFRDWCSGDLNDKNLLKSIIN